MLEHIIVQMENECGMDRSAAMADMRFDFIEKVCEATVIRPRESKERARSERIDRALTGKYTAIPCFVLIMAHPQPDKEKSSGPQPLLTASGFT